MHYLWLVPICLVLAAWFIKVERDGKYVEADLIKGLASCCFVAFGFLGAGDALGTPYARIIVSGLALGFVADVILNLRYVFEGEKGKRAFLAGILVFLAGHVAYIVALAPRCSRLVQAIILGLCLTVALMWWILGRIEAALAFKIFGFFYIGAICIMNCVAFAVLISNPCAHTAVFMGGAVLFLLSDVILILNTFGPEQRFMWRCANLMLYYVGQLLIAASLQLL